MKIISIGSLNIDKVYHVDHLCLPGETIAAEEITCNAGGKGLNQSIAAARAGADVIHAGAVGSDGKFLTGLMQEAGVDISRIQVLSGETGHAIIEVDTAGRNSIIVYGGANRKLTKTYIDCVLKETGEPGDIVLVQNETNLVAYCIRKARELGMKTALNPSPLPADPGEFPLSLVDFLIVNEVEGAALAENAEETDAGGEILKNLSEKYPSAVIVLTLGSEGAMSFDGNQVYEQDIFPVKAADTTGAGDTFCGYFLAGVCGGKTIPVCLTSAAAAAALAVTRQGAAPSIPVYKEVEQFLAERQS